MYKYSYIDKKILKIKIFNFKKIFLKYVSGILNENEFKIIRLLYGIYRQKNSYMLRISVPYSTLSINQLNLLSYILKKYDKYFFHLTTRTNFQFNWIKLYDIFDIFLDISKYNINSIQTSGNCIRNITMNNSLNNKKFDIKPFCELIRQWFFLNSEFLYLPRKFKISFLNSKKDNISLRIHDLGIYIKKDNYNKINFNLLIGGGLGRNPFIGIFLFKNLHWKNILIYSEKILKIYNIFGYRDNIYKSRIKILLKSINYKNFKNFILNDIKYNNNSIFILNEKEINNLFNLIEVKFIIIKYKIYKILKYNKFYLNWLKINVNRNICINIPIKNNNKPSGDLNLFHIKIIYFLFKIYNINLNITNRQNISINYFENISFYNFFKIIKLYFINIFNSNLLSDIISCPGLDYCNLANSESISISNDFQNLYKNFNSIIKIKNIYLNFSGCINSCAHHHISNIGLLGVNKNNESWYQIYIGGDNLNLSKVIGNSSNNHNTLILLNKIIKFYIKNKINKEFFIETYNRLGFLYFKNYIK